MKKQIKSLDQLQKERIRLLAEREDCKSEFYYSLNVTQGQAKTAFFKVGLSAGLMGLATIGIRKLTTSAPQEKFIAPRTNKIINILSSLLPPLLNWAQNYFETRYADIEE